jgi:hypothetical protein
MLDARDLAMLDDWQPLNNPTKLYRQTLETKTNP